MTTAIEKRENVVPLDMDEHSQRMERMRAVIRNSICPKGISEDEFALFMEQAKRSGLDPLLKQAFCVARRQNLGTKDNPRWADKHEFQPAEAGMLARAERFPDYRGIQASAVYAEDEITIDQGKGDVSHKFNPAKRKGALMGAWARIVREGKVPTLVWVDLSAAQQSSPLWAKMPATMVEKAARVSALRKAYPEAFGGLYIAGERPDDVDREDEEAQSAPSLSKPVVPAPSIPAVSATREATPTLTMARDTVDAEVVQPKPASVDGSAGFRLLQQDAQREPGSDDGDGQGDEPKGWEVWVHEVPHVQTRADYLRYAREADKLDKGTEGRKAMSKVLKEADARLKAEGK